MTILKFPRSPTSETMIRSKDVSFTFKASSLGVHFLAGHQGHSSTLTEQNSSVKFTFAQTSEGSGIKLADFFVLDVFLDEAAKKFVKTPCSASIRSTFERALLQKAETKDATFDRVLVFFNSTYPL